VRSAGRQSRLRFPTGIVGGALPRALILLLTLLSGCAQFGIESSALNVARGQTPEVAELKFDLLLGGPPSGGPVSATGESEKSETNGNGKPAAEPKEQGPRTVCQAICAYIRKLCSGPPDKSEKEEKEKPADDKPAPKDDKSAKKATADVHVHRFFHEPKGQETDERSPPAFGHEATHAEEQSDEKSTGDEEKPANGNGDKDDKKDSEPEWYSAHAQGTIVTQKNGQFTSPYMSNLSLQPHEPSATSETATLYYAARFWESDWQTGEVIFNPEIAGGIGLSGSNGIAGFPNGEITRVGIAQPTPYIARLYLRETIALGDETEKVEDAFNQIAGKRAVERLTIVIGKFSFTDLMDDNKYSHDPRTQFLPWSFMYNGAWDYPANVRGYSYGLGIELNQKNWALRYGMMQVPRFANGATLDGTINGFGYAMELEERYDINKHPGKLRLMAYVNHAKMGNYAESLLWSPLHPEITASRSYRCKYGFCLNWEQEICKDLGMWARLGWNDGQSESWAFTPIDRTVTFGWLLHGTCWHRKADTVGLGFGFNGLSHIHREYLAAGGQDFNLGDGALNYRPESIMESFYNWEIRKNINLTFDAQGVANPAYNHDRGPVAIGTIRVHFEY
jgi:high affinity Mn2+ porin